MTIADINILARLLSGTDTNSYTAAQLLIAVNTSYRRIVGKLISETMNGGMPFGDFNYAAFPSFTITMSNGVGAYDLQDWGTTDEETPLTIMGLEVLDQSGDAHVLNQ